MLIDFHTHIHLFSENRFGLKIDDIINEINTNQIFTITNSLDPESYKINHGLESRSKYLKASFGIHPCNAHRFSENVESWIENITDCKIIGEIGLDYFFEKDRSKYPAQKKVFATFLQEARNKLLSIHTKGAEEDVLNALIRYKSNQNVPVIHWYSGDLLALEKMIEQGFYFSISPEIKYSDKIKEIARMIPISHLLTETDNPGGPFDYLGKAGTPVLIKVVLEEMAKIKKVSYSEIELQVEENFRKIAKEVGFENDT